MIEPDVAIITLVAPAHTAELGGLEGVAREKAVLPAAVKPAGVAIFPRQCAEFPVFRALDVRTMIVEPADVLRPAEPPKDKVYFAIAHRGDSTGVSLAYGKPPPLTFTFRRVSDGMAQNAALAICAALWLGVAPEAIQARLAGWQPAKLRGEIRTLGGRMLYLDCYNANPAAMADALDAFHGIAPADQPRLFVLGGMEELGADAERYHRELGGALRLRPAFAGFDAEQRFGSAYQAVDDHKSCECAAILRGLKRPVECKLFANVCTPENPVGSCMVSSEGACAAHYTYGRYRDA